MEKYDINPLPWNARRIDNIGEVHSANGSYICTASLPLCKIIIAAVNSNHVLIAALKEIIKDYEHGEYPAITANAYAAIRLAEVK